MIVRLATLLFASVVVSRTLGQVPAAEPEFETAVVKISPAHGSGLTSMGPYGTDRFTITNAPLGLLLQIAFSVQPYQLAGEPKWTDFERYDVTAKAEDGVKLTSGKLQPRLQRLLAQRLKLTVHRETKDFSGFELVAAEGGPKLKESAADNSEEGEVYPGGMRLPHASLDWLASMLTGPAGRPVVNKTGISGSYDIELTYGKDERDTAAPSIFTALQEQLGLKLDAQKVAVEMLVIDRVDRVPAGN